MRVNLRVKAVQALADDGSGKNLSDMYKYIPRDATVS
jgi:hypothetical protein